MDEEDIEAGSDYEKYLQELKKYNKVGKVDHDDAPDATTMLAELINPDEMEQEEVIVHDDRVNISPF